MGVHIDFSNAPSDEAPESGTYPCVITKVEETVSQSSGNPMLVVDFKITDGDYEGRQIRSFQSLQPQALFAVKGMLKALGTDTSESLEIEPNELVGQELLVTGKQEPDRNDDTLMRFNIKSFKAL